MGKDEARPLTSALGNGHSKVSFEATASGMEKGKGFANGYCTTGWDGHWRNELCFTWSSNSCRALRFRFQRVLFDKKTIFKKCAQPTLHSSFFIPSYLWLIRECDRARELKRRRQQVHITITFHCIFDRKRGVKVCSRFLCYVSRANLVQQRDKRACERREGRRESHE